MELIKINIDNLSRLKEDVVATVGQFDGVHLAHLKLIEKTIEIAKSNNLKSAMFTFDPHPDFVLKKDLTNTYVTVIDEKINILKHLGLDYLVIIEFTMDVAKMSPSDFVNLILVNNCVKEVVVGFDFKYGYKGSGKADQITTYSNNLIKTHIIDEIKYNSQKIGTALIKSLLSVGKVEEVKSLMGRYYKIKGNVVTGNKVGRTINFPTANLEVDEQFAKLLPGVYVVIVTLNNQKYLGIANLGHNPSFNVSVPMVFETHIFDFNQDIYGENIEIELVKYIRSEQKFKNKEDFLRQIEKDKEFAKEIAKNIQF